MKVKFKELPRFWRRLIIVLISMIVFLVASLSVFQIFLTGYRSENAAKRASVQKLDSELIGTRFEVPRDGKDSVKVNLYVPECSSNEKLPVIFNFHGGGFVLGDADEMDTQCDAWANDWNAIIVSINYTKPDVKSINYGVEEATDTILYFAEHADEYNADTEKFSVIGHSAGGHYAAKTAINLDKEGFKLASQILVCPWTTGLPDKVNSSVAPALFILGGADPISQKTPDYQQVLRESGVYVEVKEYEGGLHPFISTPYPELSKSFTEEEKEENITEEQQELAIQAEKDIYEWLTNNILEELK